MLFWLLITCACALFTSEKKQYLAVGYNEFCQLATGEIPDIKHHKLSLSFPVSQISCATYHNLLLSKHGTLYAFGLNYYGQLGIGKSIDAVVTSPTPVNTSFLFSSIPKLKNRYSLAITKNGKLVAFGDNRNGCVGIGSREPFIYNPSVVKGLDNEFVVDAAGGVDHVLVLTKSNKLYTYGTNTAGQLGFNETVTELKEPHLLNFTWQGIITKIVAGDGYSMVVVNNRDIFVFGDNSMGKLCDGGTSTKRYVPYKLPLGFGVSKLLVGNSFSALLNDKGQVYTCGSTSFGQTGRTMNSCMNSFGPVDLPNVTDIAVGDSFMFAKANSLWYGWGNNENNVLYMGTQAKFNLPDRVNMGLNCSSIICGTYHSVCIENDTTIYTWGNSRFNQLGVPSPFAVKELNTVDPKLDPTGKLSVNYFHAFWHNRNYSSLLGWGRNLFGQLGMETDVLQAWPDRVNSLYRGNFTILSIQPGAFHTIFLIQLNDKNVILTSGANYQGQLGFSKNNVEMRTVPKLLETDENPVKIAAGFYSSAYLSSQNNLYIWGLFTYDTPYCIPVKNVTHVAAGFEHWLIVTGNRNVSIVFRISDRRYYDNETIQIDDHLGMRHVAQFNSNVIYIESAELSGYVQTEDSNIYSFGDSLFGERCVMYEGGTVPSRYDVTQVQLPPSCKVKKFDAGAYHIVFLCEDGQLYACGSSFLGQLGTLNQSYPTPTRVFDNLPSNVQVFDFVVGGYVTFLSIKTIEAVIPAIIYTSLGSVILFLFACSSCSWIFYCCCRKSRVPSLDTKEKIRLLEDFKNSSKNFNYKSDSFINFEELSNLHEIGTGVSSVVYKADWKDSTVAVKLYKSTYLNNENIPTFENELAISKKLNHPNVITLYGACVTVPRIGIVMEYAKQGNLTNLINKKTLSFHQKLSILLDIAKGMQFLHENNIIHRDLKPDNILITEEWVAKITDFGISTTIEDRNELTSQAGTFYYMAPEVTLGTEYDNKCDVFSYSIVIFELLADTTTPYPDKKRDVHIAVANNPTVRPVLPSSYVAEKNHQFLIELMQACWSHNPQKRPSFEKIASKIEKSMHKEIIDPPLLQT